MFFSRSTIAARCTHGQVLKLTSRYFAMMVLAVCLRHFDLLRILENEPYGEQGAASPSPRKR